ncbi:hypothetical protein HSX11_21075 [Oxalobacteraceae bacterium]|nr:hypothetical protein [Oxalobacteraceae bacterium]
MNANIVCMLGAVAFIALANAAEKKEESAEPRTLSGTYQVYGGSLAEMLPPTPNDRNVSFRFKGQTAKDLFNSIGPDVKKENACSGDPDYRERSRGHLHCAFTKNNGYSCYLGLDLRTGKSDVGSIC